MALLYCGLGAFFVVELMKVSTRAVFPSPVKLVVALFASGGVLSLLAHRYTHSTAGIGMAVAGAGLAVLVHRFARLVRVAGDRLIRAILTELGR